MLALLIALLAPLGPTAHPLRARCLEAEHAPSCDRWLAPLGQAAPEGDLRRACAFEAPYACGLLADKAPAWSSLDHRVEWRRIACRADPTACRALIAAMDDPGVTPATRAGALKTAARACRRAGEVCYALARRATDPKARRGWLERACAGRDGRACRDLAWRLERGDGVAMNRKRARVIGDRACQQGADDLCLHRLRQRQAVKDHAGIRRACRRGDVLSCAARDARGCLKGDARACARAKAVPPGACALAPGACTGTPSLPPYSAQRCAAVDPCAHALNQQRAQAHVALIAAADTCGIAQARVRVEIGRSGDVYALEADTEPCLLRHLEALRLPPTGAPVTLFARVLTRAKRRVVVRARAARGAPIALPPFDESLRPLR